MIDVLIASPTGAGCTLCQEQGTYFMGSTGQGFSVLVGILWALLGLLWIFVPFAIFGIKGLLKQIVAEQRRTNEILSRVHGDRLPRASPEPQPFRVGPYP
ncbi:hypothetical protein HH110_04900 [Stenotrophomonas sp. SAM-B]|uniref:hypothetical protein n=1 Tax=Stenotrophomonas sp. SAM-B TaxID=2729141 RepID=UPI0015A1C91A|nr:hypothetical protein [Stenotrophomonas sp. SAM-B]NWF32386.1 hypothetical protein [Stenotrophomonas sp. SAM-B]